MLEALNCPSFERTRFRGIVDFTNTIFHGDICFNSAKFTGERSIFAATTFYGEADFDFSVFDGAVEMGDCKFNRNATFRRAHFRETPKFTSATDITHVTFVDAIFDRGSDSSFRRIKSAMDSQKNTWEATRFFGEELKAQREGFFNLNALYWIFNDYGRSWTRPFVWLIAIWFALGLGFAKFGGFVPSKEAAARHAESVGLADVVLDLPRCLQAFIYSFQNIKLSWLFGANIFEPAGIVSWLLSLAQSIFSVVMIALIILTIRRRFKI
ncbi:MAG: pentapeptide repeat-containing protein [Candidatus Lambdaproteobacteria bacterium]|nr:pentapeptide repeat-containing protein [Candidatus Lambdaproteobacteria bacterium]